jgi:hypothetical protein
VVVVVVVVVEDFSFNLPFSSAAGKVIITKDPAGSVVVAMATESLG